MNENKSEIVYTIAVATVDGRTIRYKPIFSSRELAEQYVEEGDIEGEIEPVTLYTQ